MVHGKGRSSSGRSAINSPNPPVPPSADSTVPRRAELDASLQHEVVVVVRVDLRLKWKVRARCLPRHRPNLVQASRRIRCGMPNTTRTMPRSVFHPSTSPEGVVGLLHAVVIRLKQVSALL